jgi:hypothetical protein
LREFDPSKSASETMLFPVKKAYWYVQKQGVYGQGDASYAAKNPPFGAVFNYYLPDSLPSIKDVRKVREKKDKNFPGWEALEQERRQEGPELVLTIKDEQGRVVRTLKGTNKKGFNQVSWNLAYPDKSGELLKKKVVSDWERAEFMVTPGTYSVSLAKRENGVVTSLSPAQNFEVVSLSDGALPRASFDEIDAFRDSYFEFKEDLTATKQVLSRDMKVVASMKTALDKAELSSADLAAKIEKTRIDLLNLDERLSGNKTKAEIGEQSRPTPESADGVARNALSSSTYGPTGTHKATLELAKERLNGIKSELKQIDETTIPGLIQELKKAGAPWIEGGGL